MSEHFNLDQAKELKANGIGFAEIGRIFGVSYYTARAALDPEWLRRRREKVNESRRGKFSSLGGREHVRHIEPDPSLLLPQEPERGPFETASGIKAYRYWVPNRTALGLPMTSKGEGTWVSLPFISMQHR